MQSTLKLHTLATLILTAALTACGGGGGGGDSSPAPTPAPAPTPEVPAGSTGDSDTLDTSNYTGDKLAYFNALNEARAKAGLAPVKQNTKLDTAAQAHAEYIHLNGYGEGHAESEGKPGFTGKTPEVRIEKAGYTATGGEGISYSQQAIESFLSSIYHRVVPLETVAADIGIAQQTYERSDFPGVIQPVNVFGFGYAQNPLQHQEGYWVWPFDGAKDLAVSYTESPNPAPDLTELGYAISVAVNRGDVITPETFTLNCAGTDVATRQITASNDINKLIAPNWVFIQPEAALPHGATCTASFLGSSTKLGKFNKTWSFSTIAGLK